MVPRDFAYSRHFYEDKDIEPELVEDCVHTGHKENERESRKHLARKKYKKGELVVVFKELEERTFIITAFWNTPGGNQHGP